MTFTVLFVCTGNICRSPMAERLFRVRVDRNAPVLAESAGVAGLPGYPMDAPSAVALRELGGDPAGHAGRRLSAALVAESDLILTAEAAHRSTVVRSDPFAFRRTFTLREFGRLATRLDRPQIPPTPETLRARVSEVAEQRGVVEPIEPGADDIPDPIGESIRVARSCALDVAESVDSVVAALGLSR